MALAEHLAEHIRACFTGLWIESHEHDDAIVEISHLCHQENWHLAVWDIDRGLRIAAQEARADSSPADPLAALRSLSALSSTDGAALLVLVNFHRFLNSSEIVQAVASQISAGKQNRTFVVILAPVVQIPLELEKQFVVIEHDLPTHEQLHEIAKGIATEKNELPDAAELTRVLDAASGLTRYEAEGAFSLSLVRHGSIQPSSIWKLKSQMLKKSGLLSLYQGAERFADLGGLDALKSFCLRALQTKSRVVRPRGLLLLGIPGTGKSAICKSLGNETGRPTIVLDVGALLGSLVGQTESQTRQALRVIDAMGPSVVMIDEVEKALSGAASGGSTDSGVSARMFGTLLSWLSDRQSDSFVICTANDVSRLPPEFSRAERFDALFFLDLPGRAQKDQIWELYAREFDIQGKQRRPNDDQWTGAEIRSCCRLSALLDVTLVDAAQNVVPVAITATESVERLRKWASGRCLSADEPGTYRSNAGETKRPARRVSRDPSNN